MIPAVVGLTPTGCAKTEVVMPTCSPNTPGSWTLVPAWAHHPKDKESAAKIITEWMESTPFHPCVCCKTVMDASDGVSRTVYLFVAHPEVILLVCEECQESNNREGFQDALYKANKDYNLGLPLKER